MKQILWNAPNYAAKEVVTWLKDRKDACILDVASGTGLMGEMVFITICLTEDNVQSYTKQIYYYRYRSLVYFIITLRQGGYVLVMCVCLFVWLFAK